MTEFWDMFCYDIARKITKGRLQSQKYKPAVIALIHPITETIVKWIETNILNS